MQNELALYFRQIFVSFRRPSAPQAFPGHEAEKIRLPSPRPDLDTLIRRCSPVELRRHIYPTRIALETLVPLRLLRVARYYDVLEQVTRIELA